MRRGIALVSLMMVILSVYGQQSVQWYDVSNFAPSVRQCMISLTDDRIFIYVNTGNKDINFWIEEPQRTGALMVLNGNDLMEYRQALFNQFILECLNSLPANARVQPHIQERTKDYEIDPLANLEVEVQPVDKELLEKGLSNGEKLDYYTQQDEDKHSINEVENTDNAMSGVIQQSNDIQQQVKQVAASSEEIEGVFEGILENIIMIFMGCWLLKFIFALFSSPQKSESDKDYEDAAWFHDHDKKI